MAGHRGGYGGRVTVAVSLAAVSALAGGCRPPVEVRGRPGPDTPVFALGAPTPYVRPHRTPPAPAQRDTGVYAATLAGMLSPVGRRLPRRVYVPAARGTGVDVIDANRYRVVRRLPVVRGAQHVVPSWDLRTLWLIAPGALVPLDPRTGRAGRPVPADEPNDLYFTLDGRDALVLTARHARIEVRDPHTMLPRSTIRVPCQGLTRAEFSADGSSLVAGCAASGQLIRVDLHSRRTTGTVRLGPKAEPRDVRLSPDGATYYVADMGRGGVWTIDARRFRVTGFVRTGRGAYGLYPSRDATVLYVTNRGEPTVSLISFAQRQLAGRWRTPTPADMGGVSADGRVLWLSAEHGDVVYALSTRTGRPIRRIKVSPGPHGLCVHPQPGRFSLGHTGNYR